MTAVHHSAFRRRSRLRVVLFSGGRGSGALAHQLIRHPAIDLTVAINGYDDGASTGEVRRFLVDSLGPSDFRKNASRLATELATAPSELVALLDYRLPQPCDAATGRAILLATRADAHAPGSGPALKVWQLTHPRDERPWPEIVANRLSAFLDEVDRTGRPFEFADCSLGNLVFAGSFLSVGHVFNRAVADYCNLLRLPPGLIENVTDGTNAYLVALDTNGALLGSEEAVVDAKRQNRIDEIYLLAQPLDAAEQQRVGALTIPDRRTYLESRSATVRVNPVIVDRLRDADLIIYAPGTQHSSLFPSYITPGLSTAIASNLTAIKLLITNLQRDAEIVGSSAVDIIDRALYYLREKGRLTDPTPCLITHYLLNDPGRESPAAYVPLGAVDALEDPRLVRIGNYEEGVTGRHDAEKILTPFVMSLLGSDREPTVAVYLHDADSPNKLAQTLLEMVRGGVGDLPLTLTVVHSSQPIDEGLAGSLPFVVRSVPRHKVLEMLGSGGFEYVILFESSGMYRGEDIVALASQLAFVRLDAVWGSRRLSMKDVDEALRLRYSQNWPLKMASHFGSHLLSVLYLGLFGQYITDTLSGARAVRARYVRELHVDPAHKLANHQLLAALLTDRAEVLEIPVRFFPISPERVKRTSVVEGLRAILEIVVRRLRPRRQRIGTSDPAEMASDDTVTVGKA
jgi:2-phospho-L-lactate transferase/gluconeogenesis factor (CofD/UPF0052 family)